MDFANYDDVVKRYPSTIPPEQEEWITTLVSDANLLLSRRISDLKTRIASDPELAELARIVVVNSVIRVISNPTNVTQETIGPFSYSRPAGQNVWFRDDELAMLSSTEAITPAASVQMYLPDHRQPYGPTRVPDTEYAPVRIFYGKDG